MCWRISRSARSASPIEQGTNDCLMPSDGCVGFFIRIKGGHPEVKIVISVGSDYVSQALIVGCRNDRFMKEVVDLDQALSRRLQNAHVFTARKGRDHLNLGVGSPLGRQLRTIAFERCSRLQTSLYTPQI